MKHLVACSPLRDSRLGKKREMGKRIAVVGAGAIGGYVGAHLARAGEDVLLIDAWAEHVDTIRRDGLWVSGMQERDKFTIPIRALHISDVPQLIREKPIDVALISVKSYDTEWATMLILPYLAPGGVIVSLQNSINEDRIAAIAGWGRTMGCTVNTIGGELIGPGRVVRTTSSGNRQHVGLGVGEVHGQVTQRAEMVAALLDHAEYAAPITNLWGARWSKLVINAMRNGVSAATGMSGKERDTDETTRWLTIRLGSTAIRVGEAMGLALENVGLDFKTLARAGENDPAALRDIVDQIVGRLSGLADEQRPSMGQDIIKGRRTETDFINGLVALRGRENGVDAQIHAQVNDLVKEVESGRLKPSPALVARL